MKNYVTIFLFILLAACSQQKQKQEKKLINKRNVELTTFEVNEDIHNFGTLQAGEIAVFTFIFTNTGNNDLLLAHVDADCGCLSVKKETKPIKPGKTGSVEVEFDSSGLFGRQFKTIVVQTNAKKSKQLAIFAEVENNEIEINY